MALASIAGALGGCNEVLGIHVLTADDGGAMPDAPVADQFTPSPSMDAGLEADAVALQDAFDGSPAPDADASDAPFIIFTAEAGTGRPGIGSVVGGQTLRGPAHSLILTVGEAPGGNGSMTSGQHRLVGGVVGATQQ